MTRASARDAGDEPRTAGGGALAARGSAPRVAAIGTRVTIRRGILMSDVWIVGEDEADPSRGRIASTAPLALALEGAAAGEVVELEAGGRAEEIRVLAVLPGDA